MVPPSSKRAADDQPRFISGHHTRLACKEGRAPRKYNPRPEEIPSGICECGCGLKTTIARSTIVKRRVFAGHPVPFLRGHMHFKSGGNHHLWKGGRYIRRGYVMRYAPKHLAADGKGYVPEHRLVMEGLLCRRLKSDESVHHINGKHDDNRPENLAVMTNRDHLKHHEPERIAALKKAMRERPTMQRDAGRKGAASRWHPKSAQPAHS